MKHVKPKLLILGGTAEAGELAGRAVAALGDRITVVSSLAGQVEPGEPIAGEVRVGGFGGAEGLAAYLRKEGVEWLIDATHPYAATISAHARAACEAAAVQRLQFVRPPWQRQPGDRWVEVPDMAAVVEALPWVGRRVFVTLGLKGVQSFARLQRPENPKLWFLVRLLAPPPRPLALGEEGKDYEIVLGRGPFTPHGEKELLARHRINALVCRMSGGPATQAKIVAAREARLPVILLARPPAEPGACLELTDDAIAWLERRVNPLDDCAASQC